METAGMRDMAWLGLDWDEGPDSGGSFGPYRQSERTAVYENALSVLYKKNKLFPCRLSRSDLREVALAPEFSSGAYPTSLRPTTVANEWFQNRDTECSIRFVVDNSTVQFVDLHHGRRDQRVRSQCGDFVVLRKDGVYSYQLAVTVDDAAMNITEVVRGGDLVDSTGRQIMLLNALSASLPRYGHVPMVIDTNGVKLSKRRQSLSVGALRDAGIHPHVVCGCLAHSLGLTASDDPKPASDLISAFRWQAIHDADWIVPDDIESRLKDKTAEYVKYL